MCVSHYIVKPGNTQTDRQTARTTHNARTRWCLCVSYLINYISSSIGVRCTSRGYTLHLCLTF